MKDYSEFENNLTSKDNKYAKHEKKRIQEKDRSKHKLTDQKKIPKKAVVIGKRGRVLSVSSTEIIVDLDDKPTACSLRGILKKEVGEETHVVTIGDFVIVDERGQIASVEERSSSLARKDNLRRRKAQLIASNIDQVLIITSVEDPPLKPSLIDRYIISAKRGNMSPIVVINKIDLAKDHQFIHQLHEIYRKLHIPVIEVSAVKKKGLKELAKVMQNKASVFSGQSGVGKTTLINLLTGSDFKTGDVAIKTHKGAHTTTQSKLIKIDENSFCIDTPGIKSFSLWDLSSQELTSYFSDLQQFSLECKFVDCTHTHEPDCGVKKAVLSGKLSKIRYDSYITIREGNDEDQKHHWE